MKIISSISCGNKTPSWEPRPLVCVIIKVNLQREGVLTASGWANRIGHADSTTA